MPTVHVFSLKRGTSHGLWQYKISGTHDRIVLHGVRQILDVTCQLLGYSDTDRSDIYLFNFSSEPFDGQQVCLGKMRESSDGGCYYRVVESDIGGLGARGRFPAFVRTHYLREWPERIYFKIERSAAGGIVS